MIRNKEMIKRLTLEAVMGVVTAGSTIVLVKALTKREVENKTKELEKNIKKVNELEEILDKAAETMENMSNFTIALNKKVDKIVKVNEKLEKTTIRSLTMDDFVNTLKKRERVIVSKCVESMEKSMGDKVKEYSDYMMTQIDEVFERLEKAEQYVQGVGFEVLGEDKTNKILENIFDDGEENVAKEESDNDDNSSRQEVEKEDK